MRSKAAASRPSSSEPWGPMRPLRSLPVICSAAVAIWSMGASALPARNRPPTPASSSMRGSPSSSCRRRRARAASVPARERPGLQPAGLSRGELHRLRVHAPGGARPRAPARSRGPPGAGRPSTRPAERSRAAEHLALCAEHADHGLTRRLIRDLLRTVLQKVADARLRLGRRRLADAPVHLVHQGGLEADVEQDGDHTGAEREHGDVPEREPQAHGPAAGQQPPEPGAPRRRLSALRLRVGPGPAPTRPHRPERTRLPGPS